MRAIPEERCAAPPAAQGAVEEAKVLRKGGMEEGQALVLTKAVGTGTLLAAAMRLRADGRHVQGACASPMH